VIELSKPFTMTSAKTCRVRFAKLDWQMIDSIDRIISSDIAAFSNF
jgi:hypothetical protein